MKTHFIPGRSIDIYFDYVNSPSLNARVGIMEDLAIVAIYKGAVLLAKDMFQRMLANPRAVTFIGNAAVESSASQFSEGISNDIDELHEARRIAGRPERPPVPNDVVRQQFSIAVTQIAFDFLVQHELAHIFSGHLGYLEHTQGIKAILESSPTSSSPAENIERQAIEFGADNTAAGVTITSISQWSGPIPDHWSQFFSTPEQRVFIWCFAVGALFRLWGLKVDLSLLTTSNYPPTAMRMTAAFNTAELSIKEFNPDLSDRFHRIAEHALSELEAAIVEIGGAKLPKEDVDPVFSPLGNAHYRKIRQCWLDLIPKLRPFSYIYLRDVS